MLHKGIHNLAEILGKQNCNPFFIRSLLDLIWTVLDLNILHIFFWSFILINSTIVVPVLFLFLCDGSIKHNSFLIKLSISCRSHIGSRLPYRELHGVISKDSTSMIKFSWGYISVVENLFPCSGGSIKISLPPALAQKIGWSKIIPLRPNFILEYTAALQQEYLSTCRCRSLLFCINKVASPLIGRLRSTQYGFGWYITSLHLTLTYQSYKSVLLLIIH